MKTLAQALLALALLLPSLARAEATPESRAEAARLLDSMDLQAMLDKSITVTMDSLLATKPELQPYRGVMLEFFHKYMSYESLKPQMTDIYADAFSAKELAEIRGFYESPTGRKALQLMPSLMQAGSEMGKKRVEEHMPELVKMVQDEAERLQKASGQEKPASKP
jgi:hypothetical protein